MSRPLYTTEILRLAASLHEERELEREDGRAEVALSNVRQPDRDCRAARRR